MDGARRSTDASDEQEPKRPCLAGGRNGGAGGAGGSDAGDDDSHGDAGGGGRDAGGSGGDVGGGGGVGHAAAADDPRTLSTLGDDQGRSQDLKIGGAKYITITHLLYISSHIKPRCIFCNGASNNNLCMRK